MTRLGWSLLLLIPLATGCPDAKSPDSSAKSGESGEGQAGEALPKFDGKTIPEWASALQSSNQAAQREAAFFLGEIGPQAAAAVPQLVAALKDTSPEVRTLATASLGRIGEGAAQAASALLEMVEKGDKQARTEAGVALRLLGPAAAKTVPGLVTLLEGKDEARAAAAATILEKIGPEAAAAVPALRKALQQKGTHLPADAAGALGGIGEKAAGAVPDLEKMLGRSENLVVQQAIAALGRIGPAAKAAAPALLVVLESDRSYLHQAAARSLGQIGQGPKKLVPLLVKQLTTASGPGARAGAAAGLGALGKGSQDGPTPDVIAGLIAGLKDQEPKVRQEASDALAACGPKAMQAMRKALSTDRSHHVRMFAAEALGRLGKAEALPDLVKALEDPGTMVRSKAILAMTAIGPRGADGAEVLVKIATSSQDNDALRLPALRLLRLMGAKATRVAAALTPIFKDERVGIQVEAAWAHFAILGDAGAVLPVLKRGLASIDFDTDRIQAARCAGALGTKAGSLADDLGKLSKDDEAMGSVRIAAALAYAQVKGDPKGAVPGLVKSLNDIEGDWQDRVAAAKALATLGKSAHAAIPSLMKALEEEDLGKASRVALRRIRGLD